MTQGYMVPEQAWLLNPSRGQLCPPAPYLVWGGACRHWRTM